MTSFICETCSKKRNDLYKSSFTKEEYKKDTLVLLPFSSIRALHSIYETKEEIHITENMWVKITAKINQHTYTGILISQPKNYFLFDIESGSYVVFDKKDIIDDGTVHITEIFQH